MKSACIALLCLALASTVSAQTAAPASLADALALAPNNTLSILKAALDAADLTPALRNTSLVWTVFAPTNDAFAAAIAALNTTADELLGNKDLLTTILSYHVVPGVAAFSYNLTDGMMVPTLLGPELMISLAGGNVTIVGANNNATVIAADIPAGMSVVHVIDAVLVPPMGDATMEEDGTMTGTTTGTTTGTGSGTTATTAGTTTNTGTTSSVTQGSTTAGTTTGTGAATSAAQPQAVFGLVSGAVAAVAVLGSMLL